jgi:hypothetical protein
VLKEITFKHLPENDTEHQGWWCEWALGGDDTCRCFYYSIYEEPDSEVEGSQLKAKVCGRVYTSVLLRVTPHPFSFLLGYFPVPTHRRHFQNTSGLAISNRGWLPLGQEANRGASSFNPSCISAHILLDLFLVC